ncbi:MAG: hypothetical protein MSC30_02400 [Gaiellaceae bacterium MAG52_C11]|nr:hypothetical protein [Candidatus Gaiellasilicea maunaloa]
MPIESAVPTHVEPSQLGALTDDERRALTSAATWYFKRHARIIADEADDGSAFAVTRRERYFELHAALWKLGIRLALPDELAAHRIAS